MYLVMLVGVTVLVPRLYGTRLSRESLYTPHVKTFLVYAVVGLRLHEGNGPRTVLELSTQAP